MSDENTQIKDLTEMERLVLGSSINFVSNLLNNQIYHIENHDSELTKMLSENENIQKDYILLQNLRDNAEQLTKLFGETFINISEEDKDSLSPPAIKLEIFFKEVYDAICCGNNN